MPFLPIPYYLLVAGGGFPSLRDTQHIFLCLQETQNNWRPEQIMRDKDLLTTTQGLLRGNRDKWDPYL